MSFLLILTNVTMNNKHMLKNNCEVKTTTKVARNHVAIMINMRISSILIVKIKVKIFVLFIKISFLFIKISFLSYKISFFTTRFVFKIYKFIKIVKFYINIKIKLKIKAIYFQTFKNCLLLHNNFKSLQFLQTSSIFKLI